MWKMEPILTNNKVVVVCLSMMIMILWSVHTTEAYGTGPPVSREGLCADMTPQHGGSPQTSPPPYTITTTSKTCYTPGQAVEVTLSASASGTAYEGFFLQARKPNDNTMSYGTFDVSGNTLSQPLNCFGQDNNAVGHNSNTDKDAMSFQWTASSDLTGDVEFVATVVQSHRVYWVAAVKGTIQQCSLLPMNETMSSVTAAADTATPESVTSASSTPTVMSQLFGLLVLMLVLKLMVRAD